MLKPPFFKVCMYVCGGVRVHMCTHVKARVHLECHSSGSAKVFFMAGSPTGTWRLLIGSTDQGAGTSHHVPHLCVFVCFVCARYQTWMFVLAQKTLY